MWLWLWLAVWFAVPVQQAPAGAPAQAQQVLSSKIWIGRYTEFEEFLRTAKLVRSEGTPVGVLAPRHAFFEPGGLANGAAVKKISPQRRDGFFESYKSEIAAYKMDRLLQLDMVPPTVERRVDGELASVQLWIENARMLKDVKAQKLRAPDAEAWNRQLYRVYTFDHLVGNIDENEGNLLFDAAWNFIKVDHSRAFSDTLNVKYPLTRIDRPFFERVKALDQATVRREIGNLLEVGALNAMFRRRDAIVQTFERLATKNGEDNVFVSWPER
jgi:hypothetical protein